LATVKKMPLVDGGEGTVQALVAATGGRIVDVEVTGPTGLRIPSRFGFLGDRPNTAVIEMAAAAGLSLVPRDHRDPTKTTSYGVGELIKVALDAGAKHILFGCGDSGTCDAGVGMLQALGVKFVDLEGASLPDAAGIDGLSGIAGVDMSEMDSRLKSVKIDVACNWHNVLCGSKGVARVFGPQKGATPAQVERMSRAMDQCASIFGAHIGQDVSLAAGSGASGGLGAGLMLIGAELHPRFDIMMSFFDLEGMMDSCELVVTAEGAIDYQTPRGKIPAEVAGKAKKRGLPVIALAGTIGKGAQDNYGIGIDAYASILQGPSSLEVAIRDAERLLTESAEAAFRMVMIGRRSVTPEPEGTSESTTKLAFRPDNTISFAKQLRRAQTWTEIRV
jgi:glycerate 2-kinase